MIDIVQVAFKKALEIKMDPFMIKRATADTKELMTPLFQKHHIDREKLENKKIIGQGQVCELSTSSSLYISVFFDHFIYCSHFIHQLLRSLARCTWPPTTRAVRSLET